MLMDEPYDDDDDLPDAPRGLCTAIKKTHYFYANIDIR
jgi:hypothetical protein